MASTAVSFPDYVSIYTWIEDVFGGGWGYRHGKERRKKKKKKELYQYRTCGDDETILILSGHLLLLSFVLPHPPRNIF